MEFTEEIKKIVKSRSYRPMDLSGLAAQLSIEPERRHELESVLHQLRQNGEIIKTVDGKWIDPELKNMLVARMDVNQRGFGFAMPVSDRYEQDIFIPERHLAGAMNGDLVLVKYKSGSGRGKKNDKGPSGQVVDILERSNKKFVGTYHFSRKKKQASAKPDDPSLDIEVIIPRSDKRRARQGDKVLVEITQWPESGKRRKNPLGRVEKVLGTANSPEIDELTIIHQFNLPESYPEEALRESQDIPFTPGPEIAGGRRDLCDLLTVAVDPEDAKDCDDALSIQHSAADGTTTVFVHIADVSCYVSPDSLLDEEARERGQSVYLVRSFIPMLPREATQQKLSLDTDENRPAKTVELHYDSAGKLVSSKIYHSLVRLNAKMSYREVKEILEGDDSTDKVEGKGDGESLYTEEIIKVVKDLDLLAQQLRMARRELGSVDLDVPEYHVSVGEDGEVNTVSQIERDRSHSLVEEFMLAANVAVARYMKENNLPAIYRVHEKPDEEDINAFADFIKIIMDRSIDPFDRGEIQQLLLDVQGSNYAEAVNMELLRCMKRACYSAECSPHFALNFPVYCHFTSPIRRYPDLVIHQVLDLHMSGELDSKGVRRSWEIKLPAVAMHCTNTGTVADQAEREIIKLKLLRFLKERGIEQHETFDGVITGVKEFGFFAQLQEFAIEGLVSVNRLKGDFFVFHPEKRALIGKRNKKVYRLGQQVMLRVENIDIDTRQLDFSLA